MSKILTVCKQIMNIMENRWDSIRYNHSWTEWTLE